MPPKRSRRPVLSTTSPPPEIDQPSKRQKKGSQSLSIDYDLLADAILKKQNQFNPNSSIVHHNVAPPDTEEISTSSVVPSGNACQQNQPSAALSQIDSIPASQTVSLHVSPDPNQQPCPQPSLEPDTLSVPAVLNSLFGENCMMKIREEKMSLTRYLGYIKDAAGPDCYTRRCPKVLIFYKKLALHLRDVVWNLFANCQSYYHKLTKMQSLYREVKRECM